MKKRIGLIILLILSVSMLVKAQGGTISYGETTTASLTAEVPQAFYSFSGAAGDLVTAYILGWEESFQPTMALVGSNGQQLQFSANDPLTPLSNDARISYRLPADGVYSLLVSSENNAPGTYTLTLRRAVPVISTALADSVTLNIPQGAPSQQYGVAANANAPTTLNIQSLTNGFGVTVRLTNPAGQVIAAISGGVTNIVLTMPPGDGTYELLISSADPAVGGDVQISLGEASTSSTSSSSSSTDSSSSSSSGQTSTGTTATDPNACVISASGVNIRTGPGTNYGAIGSLNGSLNATGQYSGWYTVDYAGQQGWVFSGVVTSSGPCAGLPQVSPPPPPAPVVTEEAPVTGSPTATPIPGNTGGGGTSPTSPPPPPPPTEPSTQVAPIDSNQLNWTIDRDAGGQFSDAVSNPDGDTNDRIRLTVDGLFNQPPNNYRQFVVTLVCNGTNTGNLSWGTGGPSSPTGLSCGDSITVTHTNESNQTYININMSGSSAGYVTYTLIATKVG
ncbi:MAG: hypothetical protein Kow00117_00460 [Phototrophicales bacterium]